LRVTLPDFSVSAFQIFSFFLPANYPSPSRNFFETKLPTFSTIQYFYRVTPSARVLLFAAALLSLLAAIVTFATPIAHRHWWPFLLLVAVAPAAWLLGRRR
jgi:hypothetical protein